MAQSSDQLSVFEARRLHKENEITAHELDIVLRIFDEKEQIESIARGPLTKKELVFLSFSNRIGQREYDIASLVFSSKARYDRNHPEDIEVIESVSESDAQLLLDADLIDVPTFKAIVFALSQKRTALI